MRLLMFRCPRVTRGDDNDRFLRGVCRELRARGHDAELHVAVPGMELEPALAGADVVLVHDGNEPELIKRLGVHAVLNGSYSLIFYDTHRRAATAPSQMRNFNLAGFDGVLAASEPIRQAYLDRGWAAKAWTWHEAADALMFAPHPGATRSADLVWIGNRHDLGCSHELGRMLLEPARHLHLTGVVHGDDYPWRARAAIHRSGLRYGGPLADHLVPAVLARHRFTVELPPSPSRSGTPPLRALEAMACGIPVICCDWGDTGALLTPGRDYLLVRNAREMESAMRTLRSDRGFAKELANHGRATVLARHTCAHRAEELLAVVAELQAKARTQSSVSVTVNQMGADNTPTYTQMETAAARDVNVTSRARSLRRVGAQ